MGTVILSRCEGELTLGSCAISLYCLLPVFPFCMTDQANAKLADQYMQIHGHNYGPSLYGP